MAQVLCAWARQAWPPSVSADKEQQLLVGLLEERYAVIIVSPTISVKPTQDLVTHARPNPDL